MTFGELKTDSGAGSGGSEQRRVQHSGRAPDSLSTSLGCAYTPSTNRVNLKMGASGGPNATALLATRTATRSRGWHFGARPPPLRLRIPASNAARPRNLGVYWRFLTRKRVSPGIHMG